MKWISVKEKLPIEISNKGGGLVVAMQARGGIFFNVRFWTTPDEQYWMVPDDYNREYIEGVEYWMLQDDVAKLLPSLPKSPSENASSPGSETPESDNLDMALKKGDHCAKCGKGLFNNRFIYIPCGCPPRDIPDVRVVVEQTGPTIINDDWIKKTPDEFVDYVRDAMEKK